MLSSAADAEDLVHDLFVDVWLHPARFDRERGSVRGWLRLKARSRALDRIRIRSLRAELERSLVVDLVERPPAPEVLEVRGVLARLPRSQRVVLELAYFDGRTSKQIAEILDLPVGTVKSRTAVALEKLRALLTSSGSK
jgi:RNA polymerase sigma-70 factor, ECF subfamily